MSTPCYVTTAIPYVNARPHLGFALEAVIADALARHARARGRATWFATGTDDHSLSNLVAAERAGVPVAELVDGNARHFAALAPLLELSTDAFVSTSRSPTHRRAVETLWRACAASGDLYRQSYRGLYCVGCERFVEPAELTGGLCPEHRRPPEPLEEENWFFRLSRHRAALHDAVASGALTILPDGAREETLAFLAGPVRDLSVSRSAARARGWGLPVPGDPAQVIYVWFDALCTYLSALGWPDDDARFRAFWAGAGERCHVLGKGISRFHAVFWPAFLRSAGLPPPTRLLVHGYLTVDGEKISKSGRSLDPAPIVAAHGREVLRYYLLRHVRTTRDGDFRVDRLRAAYDAELANGLGNLVSRVAGLVEKLPGGALPDEGEPSLAADLRARVDDAVARFQLDEALAAIFAVVDAANRHIVRAAPWSLPPERAGAVLRGLVDTLRTVAAELAPFLPATGAAIAARLVEPIRRAPPLFPRRPIADNAAACDAS